MDPKIPIDEVRILRKILDGIDMVFHKDTGTAVTGGVDSKGRPVSTTDTAVLMRQMLNINKIELLVSRILFIYAESPYCRIAFESQKDFELDLRLPIHSLVAHFKGDELLRVHRSYMVNPKKVLCIDKKNPRDHEIWLKTGPKSTVQIPVGRSYVSKIRGLYPNWFKN